MTRVQSLYKDKARGLLQEKFNYSNPMQIPRVQKVTLNMGVGEAVSNKKFLEDAVNEMTLISGQKPVITRAKKSIAGFKLREDMPIGCKVTLRGAHMWEFIDRLVTIALPRVRDFRSLNRKSFDGAGNYSLGIKEHIIFNEINYDKVERIRGLDVTVTTSASNDEEAMALLRAIDFPFGVESKAEEAGEGK